MPHLLTSIYVYAILTQVYVPQQTEVQKFVTFLYPKLFALME